MKPLLITVRGLLVMLVALALMLFAPTGIGVGIALADPYGYEEGDSVDVDPEPVDDFGGDPDPVDDAPEPEPAPEPELPDEAPPADDPGDEGGLDGPEVPEAPGPEDDPGAPDESGPGAPDEPGPGEDPGIPDDLGPDEDPAGPDEDDLDPIEISPTVAEAPEPDTTAADEGLAGLFDPDPADETDLDELREFVETTTTTTTTTTESTSSQQISQWSSSWVRYDQYYRPVFSNPYRTPLSLVYTYGGSPRIVTVPPLQRAVIQVPTAGMYSFTALANRDAGTPVISVGSFSGGGYAPAPGQPPPPKPASPNIFKNVVVRFNLGATQYKPIQVASVVDVGDDPAVGGHQVLLDGEVPVWGTWQADDPNGHRVFEVNKTQTLPGLEPPSQSPPPGYTLTAAESSTAQSEKDKGSSSWIWIVVGVGAVLVGALAVGLILLQGRRSSS